jgi:signal transduction histidine kinase
MEPMAQQLKDSLPAGIEPLRLQELMIQAEKRLSMGGLAAGMAHEINNPLGIISQAAANIQRRVSPGHPSNQAAAEALGLDLDLLQAYLEQRQVPEFLAAIREAVERITRIVGNLCHFSARSDATPVPGPLPAVVQRALELATSDFQGGCRSGFRNIETRCEFEPELPPVPMVANEIEQVLLALLMNATRAMAGNPPERPPRLDLRAWHEPRHVALEVKDNGPGMDEALLRRIFDPFSSTHSGLGLPVAYLIITRHHQGRLEVASAPGQGACFTIRMPI